MGDGAPSACQALAHLFQRLDELFPARRTAFARARSERLQARAVGRQYGVDGRLGVLGADSIEGRKTAVDDWRRNEKGVFHGGYVT